MRSKDTSLLRLAVVFLVAAATHFDTLSYWFAATDTLPLIETSRVGSAGDVIGLFTQPLMAGSDFVTVALFYRPISSLSYALGYSLWGLSPAGYHLTNVVLHATAAVLVAVTIATMTTRPNVGFLSGLLFAVHPLTGGIVPAIARRQDILLAIFVLCGLTLFVRSRRHHSRRLLGGAVLGYALALGSKETALVFPGLVFAWVVIHHDTGGWRQRLVTAVTTTAPFVFVTGIYFLVRLSVLGGLGGYQSAAAPGPGIAVLFVPVKYLLWIGQPTNAVGRTVSTLPRPALLAVLAVGAVCVVFCLARIGFHRRLETPGTLVVAVSGVGFGTVFAGLAFASRIQALIPAGVSESSVVVRYLIGALFVGGCLAGLVIATHVRTPAFDTATRRSLGFLFFWAAAIPGLLMATGAGIGDPLAVGDQIQTGYLCIAPAMAGLSLLVLTAGKRLVSAYRSGTLRLDANVALVVFTMALVVPLVATSPLVHSSDGWQQTSDLNRQLLTHLDGELNGTPPAASVYVLNPPVIESADPEIPSSVKQLTPYSVEAWLRLKDPPERTTVKLVGRQALQRAPADLSLETTRTNHTVVVRPHPVGRETRSTSKPLGGEVRNRKPLAATTPT